MSDDIRILIIEDNQEIVDSLSITLKVRWAEAKVISTSYGEEGIELIGKHNFDVCMLDLGLPDISGFEVLKRARLFSTIPIIILSVRGEERDVFQGLELGADDYIIKPFRQLELLARVRTVTRRTNTLEQKLPISSGTFRLDTAENVVLTGDKRIGLTHTECRLLELLMENSGRTVSHTKIAEYLWGDEFVNFKACLKVYIGRLRQKLEPNPKSPQYIITQPRSGYSFIDHTS